MTSWTAGKVGKKETFSNRVAVARGREPQWRKFVALDGSLQISYAVGALVPGEQTPEGGGKGRGEG